MDGSTLWSSVWASYNPRDGGSGAVGRALPPPQPQPAAPPASTAAPPPLHAPPPPPFPAPTVSSLSLEAYLELADALVGDATTRRVKRVGGLAASGIPTTGLKAALALHGCGSSKGGKQDLLDRAAGMRLRYPTALADAAPPDCDAAVVHRRCGGGGLAVTAADLAALGWVAATGPALDAALAGAVDLSVSVEGAAGGVGVSEVEVRPSPPPSSPPAKRPCPAADAAVPAPPSHIPAVGELVWVPLGAAWWPAEVTGVGAGAPVADASAAAGDAALSVSVLALNTPMTTPLALTKPIMDEFETHAGGVTTAAGIEAVALARARLTATGTPAGGA